MLLKLTLGLPREVRRQQLHGPFGERPQHDGQSILGDFQIF